jgi:hypothetical protein
MQWMPLYAPLILVVARSASPDLSDRALIRAAEQNRSSRSPSDLASKLASPIPNRSTRRYV